MVDATGPFCVLTVSDPAIVILRPLRGCGSAERKVNVAVRTGERTMRIIPLDFLPDCTLAQGTITSPDLSGRWQIDGSKYKNT